MKKILTLLPLVIFSFLLHAQNQRLDPTFIGGTVLIPELSPSDITLQQDGKILIGHNSDREENHSFSLYRLNKDGSLDQQFGQAGKVNISLNTPSFLRKVALQSDGKIILGGTVGGRHLNSKIVVLRLNDDGSVDAGFGTDGKVFLNQSTLVEEPFNWMGDLVVMPDDKIVVAGSAGMPSKEGDDYEILSATSVFRLTPNGLPDDLFGTDGGILFLEDSNIDEVLINNVGVLSDGKIIISGVAVNDYSEYSYNLIYKLNQDGTLDRTFNNGSNKIIGKGGNTKGMGISDMIIKKNDKILLAASFLKYLDDTEELHGEIIQLTPEGNYDDSFGDKGIKIGLEGNDIHLALQQDQNILVAYSDNLIRFDQNGNRDLEFGNNGILKVPVAVLDVQPDNKILVASRSGEIRRYINDHEVSQSDDKVVRFMLINSKTNEELFEIKDGAIIDLFELETEEVNIRAYTVPEKTGSVKFNLTGAEYHNHIENVAPYALFGNDGEDYLSWKPAGGEYSLTATPYSVLHATGTAGSSLNVSFSILPYSLRIQKLTLINAEKNTEIRNLDYQYNEISFKEIGTNQISIRAYTFPTEVGSVKFHLKSRNNEFPEYVHIENAAPYAMFKNEGINFFGWNPKEGTYTLTVTPFAKPHAQGAKGLAKEITLEFLYEANPQIDRITLINADTDEELFDLENGAVINLQEIGTDQINFRAYTSPAVTGSVEFDLLGPVNFSSKEFTAPYAVFGNMGDDYYGWQAVPGKYELQVTPRTEINTGGTIRQTNIRFSIESNPDNENLRTTGVYPNPGSGSELLQIPVNNLHQQGLQASIYDLTGNAVLIKRDMEVNNGRISLDVSHLKSQPYIIKVTTAQGVKTYRWIRE